ncbi:MAG: response regulator, partial [Candidatus Zixiibacteriota bacterium]
MLNEPKIRILVVDDEEHICSIITEALASDSYEIVSFSDPEKAIDYIEKNQVDLVLTDLVMGEYSGTQILDTTLKNYHDSVVILMTAHPTVKTAISVLRKGAYDFMLKPFKLEVMKATVRRGLAHQKVIRENLQLKSQVEFLKVANAFGIGADIEKYLKMVVNSCKTELSAAAVSLMEIDPKNGQLVRKIYETDNDAFTREILDEKYFSKFAQSQDVKPYIRTDEIVIDGISKLKTFISKPILISRKLHGTINLLIIRR